MYEDDVYLSVSYDFEAREKSDLVYENMLLSPVPIAVLILASPVILEKDVEEMIMLLNMCSSVESVEIKPYSINQANSYTVTHKDFEDHIIKWLEADTTKNFQFVNEDKIQSSISKEYNAFSDNHIYITTVDVSRGLGQDFFLELATWQDYIAWTEKEKSDNVSSICKSCKYFGNCLTEHYRYVKDLDNSCNGYRGLLEYMEYKNA